MFCRYNDHTITYNGGMGLELEWTNHVPIIRAMSLIAIKYPSPRYMMETIRDDHAVRSTLNRTQVPIHSRIRVRMDPEVMERQRTYREPPC